MTAIGTDWRRLDGVTTAWFETPSTVEAARLAARAVELSAEVAVELRPSGVRVRLDSDEHAATVSAAARDLGLTADPAVLQQLDVVIDTSQPSEVTTFWRRVLDYGPAADHRLSDPLRRDPTLRIRRSSESLPLRNRVHLDVVRPAAAVAQAGLGDARGPYGVRHSDPDGNEVDLVPGGPLGDGIETADWQVVFSAMVGYRTSSSSQQRDFALAAGRIADDTGFPLLVDLRPGLVILDSGKDGWEADAHGLDVDFTDVAARLQTAARDLGAVADPGLPRFTQLFLDAAAVATVRAFWVAALGYVHDRRAGLSDIHDLRRLHPVLAFQELDPAEADRRRQRNRIHVELTLPPDVAPARLTAIVDAGGRLLAESADRRRFSDPEGNELVIVTAEARSRRCAG